MSTAQPTGTTSQPSSSTFAARSAPGVRDAITAANARFVAALREGDANAAAACYTADAQLLPANSEPVAGTDDIAGFWRGALAMGIAGARLETLEVESEGDLAAEVGRYTLTGADGGTLDTGKYVVLWHRDGGAWKLHRDIWTTSRPAPVA